MKSLFIPRGTEIHLSIPQERRLGWWPIGVMVLMAAGWLTLPGAWANHRGSDGHEHIVESHTDQATGRSISGTTFQVFLGSGKGQGKHLNLKKEQADLAIRTVVSAFEDLAKERKSYKRFDEALSKNALYKVIIEPKVFNRDGKEFAFLVARTKQKGRVNLLINASELEKKGYINHPEKLVPVLAKEFQWVVSKADTTTKRKSGSGARNLARASILSNKTIRTMSGTDRKAALQALFEDYLLTVDSFGSLRNQPYYDIGTAGRKKPEHEDSTINLYDIRVREALQYIVQDPYFVEHTPKAVRSLLNGRIWNVTYADIPSRDWATRTRVVPKDKSVKVGPMARTLQPAKVLVNVYQFAAV